MRIVGGKYKRRLIEFPSSNDDQFDTRPTKDRIREAVFNALGNTLDEDTIALDLFAGSGSLGIEALSRGAKKAFFVDARRAAVKTIKANLNSLNIEDGIVIEQDYQAFLNMAKDKGYQFSLVLLDPPYKMDVYHDIINYLEVNSLLSDDAYLVLESDHPLDFDEQKYKEIRHYQYGFIHVTIIAR